MKFAFHLHAARSYWGGDAPSAATQSAIFDWAHQTGFDAIDIGNTWNFELIDADEARNIRRRAADSRVELRTLNCMGRSLCDAETGAGNFQSLRRSIQVADSLDIRVLNVSLSRPRKPGVPIVHGVANTPGGSRAASPSDYSITVERLGKLAREAQTHGIALSLELHDRALSDTAASILRIIAETGEPNVGSNPDICNGYRAYDVPDETWQETITALAPSANLWHVNNLKRVYFPELNRAAFVEAALSDGDVDYRWALAEMRRANFDGWVVIENKASGDTFELSRQGLEYFRGLLAAPAIVPEEHSDR